MSMGERQRPTALERLKDMGVENGGGAKPHSEQLTVYFQTLTQQGYKKLPSNLLSFFLAGFLHLAGARIWADSGVKFQRSGSQFGID